MKFSLKNLSTVIPVIKETFSRFPLVIICVISTTVLSLLLLHKVKLLGDEDNARLLGTFILSGISLVSLKLLAESKSWSQQKHLIGAVIVVVIICLFTWEIIVPSAESVYQYLSIAVITSLVFAPYINRSSSAASVWYFNYQTGVAVFFAGVATVILGAGLALILVSTGYLFEIKIPDKLYADIWIISWGLLFSIYFLANLSKEFDFKEESCGFPKGIRFITNYIMVPLMWAYMAILYAYVFKIIIQWELPRGNLGWMITTFGVVGIVTKLLAFPIRNEGTFLLKLFDRYYYYALIVPILLLAVAIGVRINDYGLTESRYGVVLLGIWFSAVVIITFVKKDQFHIKSVPMIFALLAFFASFGPWGAVDWSVNNQLGRFKAALEKHGLLVDGHAVKLKGELSFSERQSLSSIADYLAERQYRYKKVKPLFENLLAEKQKKQKKNIKDKNKKEKDKIVGWQGGRNLLGLMGVEYVNRWDKPDDGASINFYNTMNTDIDNNMLRVSGYDFIGTGYLDSYTLNKPKAYKTYTFTDKQGSHFVMLVNGSENIMFQSGDDQAIFNYKDYILGLKKKGLLSKNAKNENFVVFLESNKKRFKMKINFESIYGKVTKDNKIKVSSLRYLFLLKFNQ